MSPPKVPRTFLYILIMILILPGLSSWSGYAKASRERVIYIELSQFKFEPGRIIVNRGDTIVFKLRSTDVTHGFFIDGYGVDVEVPPGDDVTIRITADELGKFKIRCSVTCGPLHPFMVGDFLVVENNINIQFAISIGLILLLSIIALIRGMRGGDEWVV